MALPPSEAGVVNAMLAWAFPAVATGLVGAPGTILGITAPDGDDATEFPAALVATTVKV